MKSRHIFIGIAVFALSAIGVIAFIADGSLEPSGPPASQLREWVTNSGLGQNLGTLHGDDAHVADVLKVHPGTGRALATICGVLSTDALSANSSLPSPDTTVTTLLSKAYTLEYNAGTTCNRSSSSAALASSAHDRSAAEAKIASALARIHTVTGTTVSTTTTTSPTSTTPLF